MLLEHSGYCRMLWIHYAQGSVTTIIPVCDDFWMEQVFDGRP